MPLNGNLYLNVGEYYKDIFAIKNNLKCIQMGHLSGATKKTIHVFSNYYGFKIKNNDSKTKNSFVLEKVQDLIPIPYGKN